MKLMYGPSIVVQSILYENNNLFVFNLSSLNEQYPRLYLIPPIELGRNNDFQFDVNYANWIMYNDPVFIQLMAVMSNIYNGYDVFITISEEDWSADMADSLMKFIQERYGVVGANVRCMEDYYCISDVEFTEGMGLMNIQNDMERFGELTYRPKQGTNDSLYC